MVQIIDSTLREGTQAAGVRLGKRESAEIASSLVSIGIDMVECGHPYVSEDEAMRVRRVVDACGSVPVLSHARARKEDIEAVKEVGAQWVGIFVGVNEASRQHRLTPKVDIPRLISESVAHAKSIGLRIRFTVEDASRTPWHELSLAYRTALNAGADRICFADTVGALCPWQVDEVVRNLCREFVGRNLEVHFHDDRGLADANALSAARAGATWVSCAVNGVGERCGITDTLVLLANLNTQGWRPLQRGELLPSVGRLVESHTRFAVDRRRPVVGHNAFTHVAKLHQRASRNDSNSYCWISPELVGRSSLLDPERLPADKARLINRPKVVSATELRHHRQGPGDRYLMLDNRVVQDSRQYCIVRNIPQMDEYGPGHVDVHRHCVDSLFLFIGRNEGLTGLTAEVRLGERSFIVDSPCSVFIPSGVEHSYSVVSGTGLFMNHVLAGDYNSSLLSIAESGDCSGDGTTAASGMEVLRMRKTFTPADLPKPDPLIDAMDILLSFTRTRIPEAVVTESSELSEVFESLTFLDFFLYIEDVCGGTISLDDVAAARTFGDVATVLAETQVQI